MGINSRTLRYGVVQTSYIHAELEIDTFHYSVTSTSQFLKSCTKPHSTGVVSGII